MQQRPLDIRRRIKSFLSRDLGGPSLVPTRVWGTGPLLPIVLVASLLALVIDQLSFRYPLPMPRAQPARSPPPPHFAIDDLDLGPTVRLTRFYPNFDVLFAGAGAVEGGDGKLYVAYDPGRAPWTWDYMGENAGELSILDKGALIPVRLLPHKAVPGQDWQTVGVEGYWNGMPIVRVQDRHGDKIVYDRYVGIGTSGIETLSRRPSRIHHAPWPCISFDGGQICQIATRQGVTIALPGRNPIIVRGASYLNGPPYQGRPDTGELWLVGGGRRHFLLVEWHIGQGAAECLEGDAI